MWGTETGWSELSNVHADRDKHGEAPERRTEGLHKARANQEPRLPDPLLRRAQLNRVDPRSEGGLDPERVEGDQDEVSRQKAQDAWCGQAGTPA